MEAKEEMLFFILYEAIFPQQNSFIPILLEKKTYFYF